MPLDLHGIRIDEIAIHQIPRAAGRGARAAAVLSEETSTLTDDLRVFFQNKIIEMALSEQCFSAHFLPDSQVHPLVEQWHARPRRLLPVSQDLAKLLVSVQTAVNSGGLLAVAAATYQRGHCLVLLKLEHDEGVRVLRERRGGRNVLELEHIRELMLTQKTRAFKQAFIQPTAEDTILQVADAQRNRQAARSVADFFLREFLGADTLIDPREATKNFAVSTRAFINERIDDPEAQVNAMIQLTAALGSEDDTLSASRFARSALPTALRDDFREYVRERGVPAEAFRKDTQLVAQILSSMRLTGKSGMVVVGPPAEWSDRVALESRADGQTTVSVTDEFHKIGS